MNFILNLGPWTWVILAALILAVEVLGGGGFLLAVGFSALVIALLSWLVEISWPLQLMVFAGLSVVTTYFYWKYYKPSEVQSEDPILNNRMERLVGTKTELIQPVKGGTGKVQIADALWTVACETDFEIGTTVEVTGYDDSTLIVQPVDSGK